MSGYCYEKCRYRWGNKRYRWGSTGLEVTRYAVVGDKLDLVYRNATNGIKLGLTIYADTNILI